MKFLKQIGYQDLLLIALLQGVFHFGFLRPQNTTLALNDWQSLLLILSSVCLAGGAFLINSLQNKNFNKISEPQNISENIGYNWYIVLNVIGVGIGFYLSNHIGKPGFSGIFIIVAATLYLYATSLKKNLIVGNLIIASVAAISILMVGIYDLLPMITPENQPYLKVLFEIFIDYAVFVFLLIFIRETLLDFITLENDLDTGNKTLPIVIGEKASKLTLSIFICFLIVLSANYTYTYLFVNELYPATIYSLALILAPLFYVLIHLWGAHKPQEYIGSYRVLKGVLIFAGLLVLVIELTR